MNKKIFKNMLKEKETNTSSNLLNAGESVTFTNREKKKQLNLHVDPNKYTQMSI